MDDRSTDREKKGKDFDFGAKVANFSAGSLKAKKLSIEWQETRNCVKTS